MRPTTDDFLRVVLLVKGKGEKQENYIFCYSAERSGMAILTAGRWADDEGLSFDWNDARNVCERIRG